MTSIVDRPRQSGRARPLLVVSVVVVLLLVAVAVFAQQVVSLGPPSKMDKLDVLQLRLDIRELADLEAAAKPLAARRDATLAKYKIVPGKDAVDLATGEIKRRSAAASPDASTPR